MADLIIPKSDKGFSLSFTVQDSAGAAYNLTGYTVTFKAWAAGSPGNPVVSAACVVDVAASGTCHYVILATDFIVAAEYLWEIELTKTGYIESTRHYTLRVEESA